MKRYTKPVNIRFETPVDNKLREIKQRDSQCRRENWSKSDIVRHFVKVGIRQWEHNMERNKLNV